MSYEIVYDKQFVKCEHGIIPIVLTGSSNCTMFYGGREIRERYWESWFATNKHERVAFSEQEIMEWVYSIIPSTYNEHFMYRSKWVDDNGFVSFFKNGIKSAKTIEEIISLNMRQELNCRLSVWTNENHSELNETITTTKGLDEWIENAQMRKAELRNSTYTDKYSGETNTVSIYMSIGFNGIEPLKKGSLKEPSVEVIAKYKSNYICKIDKHGFTSCVDANNALIFKNIDEAKTLIKYWQHYNVKFISAEALKKRLTKQNYYIVHKTAYSESIVSKATSRHLYYTGNMAKAQKFTLEAAKKWVEKQSKRNWSVAGTFEIRAIA